MPFPDLQTLLQASNSSRQFLLSLPVDVQLQLHEQNDVYRDGVLVYILFKELA